MGTLDGIIVSWNTGAQKIYGYTETEAVGKPISMLVPPELPDEENKVLEMLRAGGRIQHFETVRVTKTGKSIDVSLTISPIKGSSGRIVGCSGIARDISERKRAEENLRESEARERTKVKELEALLEAVLVPVLIAYDKECRQMKGNRAAQEQLHVAANQNFSQSGGPDERPAFRQIQDGMEIPADFLDAAGGGHWKTGARTFDDRGISGWDQARRVSECGADAERGRSNTGSDWDINRPDRTETDGEGFARERRQTPTDPRLDCRGYIRN